MVFELQYEVELPEKFIKPKLLDSTPRYSDSVGLGKDLMIFISSIVVPWWTTI